MTARRFPHFIKRHIAILIFIACYLAMVRLTYQDFGLTWDEPINYTMGVASYEHVFSKKVAEWSAFNKTNGWLDIQDAETFPRLERFTAVSAEMLYYYLHYSAFYPMVLFILNKDKSVERYHLLNMVFALAVFITVYVLLYRQYRDQKLAMLGPLLLFLTPRFTGDIPANPKDVPFAVMYFISCAALYLSASGKNALARIVCLGILFGITQNIRTAGVTLYGILIVYDSYAHYRDRQGSDRADATWSRFLMREALTVVLVGMVALLFSLLTWPYLAMNLIPNLREIFAVQRHYTWNETVLYNGSYVEGTKLPGTYFTTWFAIATPLMILAPALLSPVLIRKRFQHRLFVLCCIMIVLNAVVYLIVRPVAYDGVRLFLFLVPPLATLAALALIEYFRTARNRLIQAAVGILICMNAVAVAREMIILHPYQYIYFNALVGGLEGAYKKYDTDYWGASYNEAINWFKENIATDANKYYPVHIFGIKRYKVYQAANILNVPAQHAEYMFRFTRRMEVEPQKEDIVHVIERHNVPLVYILRNTPGNRPTATPN